MPPATISLIGSMGAGKTTVGRRVAEILGRPFVDTDDIVTKAKGKSISSIFEQESESAFRAAEADAVKEAAGIPGAVVACGGGVVLNETLVAILRAAGPVVYLEASAEVAAARLDAANERPILKGHDHLERLSRIMAQRSALYESAATHIVDGAGAPEQVAKSVLAALSISESPAPAPGNRS